MGVYRKSNGGVRRAAAKFAGFGMILSAVTFTATVTSSSVVSAQTGSTPCAGAFQYRIDEEGDLAIVYDQFPSPNDNSYGDFAVGWGGPNKHTFDNLVGSDKAGFQIKNPAGQVVLSWNLDYISEVKPAKGQPLPANAPSGYASLGPFDGEGKVLVGTLTPADIEWSTSLDRNLNASGYFSAGAQDPATLPPVQNGADLLEDSPPTLNNTDSYTLRTPNPWTGTYENPEYPAAHPQSQITGWNFHNTYFSQIKASKLQSLGFDPATWTVEPNLTQLHNSPAKAGCVNPPAEYVCLGSTATSSTAGTVRARTTDPAMTHVRARLTPQGGGAAITSNVTPLSIGVADVPVSGLSANTTYDVQLFFLPNAGAPDNAATASAAGVCPLTTNPPPFVYECVAASSIGATSATIGGSTDNPNATRAVFTVNGPGAGQLTDDSATDAGGRKTFEVTATGLTPGANYSFSVEFFNGNTSLGSSPANGCPFNTVHTYVCVAPTPAQIGSTTATVGGRTTNPTVSRARFTLTPNGPGPNNGAIIDSTATVDANNDRNFEVQFQGLTPNTDYTFVVEFLDGGLNVLGTSSNVAGQNCPFKTNPAPQYVCVNATNIGQTTATVTGRTNDADVTKARFVLSPAAGPSQVDDTAENVAGGMKQFSVDLTGLTPNTDYTFVVQFLDANDVVQGSSAGHLNNCPFTTNPASPQIQIIKYVNEKDANTPAEAPFVKPGDPLAFRYVITNVGNTPLTNVTLTDDKLGPIPCAAIPATLNPNVPITCTATGPAPAAGEYKNTGTVVGTPTTGGPNVTAQDPAHAFVAVPRIDIEKFVNGQDADSAPGPFVESASTLMFRFEVTNTGNVALTNLAVTDLITVGGVGGVTVNCPPTPSLAAGASITCTGSGPAPTAGQYRNVGTVTGKGPDYTGQQGQTIPGQTVTDDDPAHAFAALPAIEIIKFVNGDDADTAPGQTVPAGSALTFRFRVTNKGNVTLTQVNVTDAITAGGTGGVTVSCPATVLAPGAFMDCSGSGTAPASGQYTNIGTVTGKGPDTTGPNGQTVPGTTVTDDNPANVTVPPNIPGTPAIVIVKFVNNEDADNAPGVIVPGGSTLNFRYEVTNTGSVRLTNVEVTDRITVGGSGTVQVSCPSTVLDPGGKMTCTATGPAPAAGQYTNIGRVTGTPPSGPPVTSENPANAFAQTPAIDIVKFVNGADADTPPGLEVPVGSELVWTYAVTNTGNVTLTNVTVVDDKGVVVDCGNGTHIIPSLAVGERKTCVGRGTATVAGLYTNIGTVTGTPPSGPNVTDSNPANHTAIAAVEPSVAPPTLPPDVTLPPTGSNSGGLVWAAFLLLGVGAALLVVTRLRRRAVS